jgi:hypothetical protein
MWAVSRDRMTPEERSLRGRLGAYLVHARHNTRQTTAAAREAFHRRFVDEVDPDRRLPEGERRRRAAAARKAYFTRLAYISARSRRAQRTSTRRGEELDDRPADMNSRMR